METMARRTQKTTRKAIIFPHSDGSPTGPIPKGLIKLAKKRDYGIVTCEPGGFDAIDKYDYAILYHNRPDVMPNLKTSCKIGWWMNDYRPISDVPAPNIQINNIFLCNTQNLDDYASRFKCKATYMPQCGIWDVVRKGKDMKQRIVFIGNHSTKYHSNRAEIMNLFSSTPAIPTKDFMWIKGDMFTENTKWIYKKADFCLSISPVYEGYTSNRLYNILSSGGFCLSLYYPGIESLFNNHEHLVWFRNKNELRKIINYYTKHPNKRKKIARQGKLLYEQKHTVEHRVDNMFSIMQNKTNKFKGYLNGF